MTIVMVLKLVSHVEVEPTKVSRLKTNVFYANEKMLILMNLPKL